MKIGFIGMGVVGGTTSKILSGIHEIYPYDKYKSPYNNFNYIDDLAKNSEIVFVCVPTPVQKDKSTDYSPIHNSIGILLGATYKAGRDPRDLLVTIRSTAVSGTTDGLAETYPFRFAFNPEFLTEKNAERDMKNTTRVVIGANTKEDIEKLTAVYKPIFPNAKYIITDRKTAEFIKFAANYMLSSHVLDANVLEQIAQKEDIRWEEVRNAISLDDRIGKNLIVPGHDGFRGFGGKCFPKDRYALYDKARKLGVPEPVLAYMKVADELNIFLRGSEGQDWLNIAGATSENKNFKTK